MSKPYAYLSIPTKILLPVDFSPSSFAAMDVATDLAVHFQAALFLVHVLPEFPTTSLPDLEVEQRFIQAARQSAEQRLKGAQGDLIKKGLQSAFSIESDNDIAGSIMDVVKREHADMLVISTHGISGWHPLLFGSTAEKVIRLVQCPLLLLHSIAD